MLRSQSLHSLTYSSPFPRLNQERQIPATRCIHGARTTLRHELRHRGLCLNLQSALPPLPLPSLFLTLEIHYSICRRTSPHPKLHLLYLPPHQTGHWPRISPPVCRNRSVPPRLEKRRKYPIPNRKRFRRSPLWRIHVFRRDDCGRNATWWSSLGSGC